MAQPLTLEDLVSAACAAALLVAAGWLLVALTLATATCVVDALGPHRPAARLHRLTDRVCPAALRRLVAVTLGALLAAACLTPAQADPAHRGPGPADPLGRRLAGLRLPERTTDGRSRAAVGAPDRPRAVVVRSGDSLWSLTVDRLPSDASDAAVCRGWHRLLRRNAARVGPDPDLLRPGTRLVLPALLAPARKEPS